MNRFPYKLYIKQTESAEQNFEGDFSPADSEVWKYHSECRDEVNGSGKTATLANGENISYAGIIYLPKSSKVVAEKVSVIVCKDCINISKLNDEEYVKQMRSEGKIRLSGTVKGFEESRLNIRLWV
jgi:hypothetical protein